jgi:excisionase family DNA binding protein
MFEDFGDLLTAEEFAEMLSIGKNAVYKLLASGKVKCFRQDRIWKIPKEGAIQYIREQSHLL